MHSMYIYPLKKTIYIVNGNFLYCYLGFPDTKKASCLSQYPRFSDETQGFGFSGASALLAC